MRILYIAKHGCGDNNDENAISYALTKLGHEVQCEGQDFRGKAEADLLLCHKLEDMSVLDRHDCPKAFWYFDLIQHDDFHLEQRSKDRVAWVERITEHTDIGFMTDGDWAADHGLHHLMQGADERVTGPGTCSGPKTDLIFAGSTIHGGKRMTFVSEMLNHYGRRFTVFGHHPKDRRHGRALANVFADHRIVVCPDGPVTDRYWSNRVYQALGFGAFVLHPFCLELTRQLMHEGDLVYYFSRADLHDKIRQYLADPYLREIIAAQGFQTVLHRHLYRHRCAQLIATVRKEIKS